MSDPDGFSPHKKTPPNIPRMDRNLERSASERHPTQDSEAKVFFFLVSALSLSPVGGEGHRLGSTGSANTRRNEWVLYSTLPLIPPPLTARQGQYRDI